MAIMEFFASALRGSAEDPPSPGRQRG